MGEKRHFEQISADKFVLFVKKIFIFRAYTLVKNAKM